MVSNKAWTWALLLTGISLIYLYLSHDLSGNLILGHFPDAWTFVWNFWWAKQAIAENLTLLHTEHIFYPFGTSLQMHSFVPGITIPFAVAFGHLTPFQLYFFACLLCFALNYICAFLLFKTCSGSKLIAACLAIILSLHPYFIAHLQAGHLNLICFFPVLIGVWALIKLRESDRSILLWQYVYISAVGFLAFVSVYYFYFVSLLTVPYFLYSRKLTLIKPLLLSILIAAIRFVPMFLIAEEYAFSHRPKLHGADLLSLVVPGTYQQLNLFSSLLADIKVNSSEAGTYLGLSLPVLILTLLWWKRGAQGITFFLISAAFFLVLSLSSKVQFAGEYLFVNYIYKLLYNYLPFFPSVPARFFSITLLSLLIVLAILLKEFNKFAPSKRLIVAVLLILLSIEILPLAANKQSLSEDPIMRQVAALKIRALHDTSEPAEQAMVNQIFHGKKITNAFISRRSRKVLREYRRNYFFKFLNGKKAYQSDLVRKSWETLKIDAVLVKSNDQKKINQLKQVPWLKLQSESNTYKLFTAQDSAHIA